jgi:hypothetical protein
MVRPHDAIGVSAPVSMARSRTPIHGVRDRPAFLAQARAGQPSLRGRQIVGSRPRWTIADPATGENGKDQQGERDHDERHDLKVTSASQSVTDCTCRYTLLIRQSRIVGLGLGGRERINQIE